MTSLLRILLLDGVFTSSNGFSGSGLQDGWICAQDWFLRFLFSAGASRTRLGDQFLCADVTVTEKF